MTPLLGLLLAALPAWAASTGTIRLALIEDSPTELELRLTTPVRALFSASSSSGTIDSVQTLPCYYAEDSFRFRIPQSEVETGQAAAAALESGPDLAVVWPPEPGLIAELRRLAAEPATYGHKWSADLAQRSVRLTQVQGPEGEALVTVQLAEAADEAAVWHNSVAVLYKGRWEGREVTVAVIGRVFSGLGRLASAFRRANLQGSFLGVARGGTFGTTTSETSGRPLAEALERAGLKYSSIGSSELRRLPELNAYRADRPDGIQYLSANIVYSTSPGTSYFPSRALVRFGGVRAAIVGLTQESSEKYLTAAGLGNLTVSDGLDAVEARIAELRRDADVLILLGQVSGDLDRIRRLSRGIDIVVAEEAGGPRSADLGEASVERLRRSPYEPPVWTMRSRKGGLALLEAEVSLRGTKADWRLRERHDLLDDSLPPAPGFSEFDPESYGIAFSTEPPLIPAARDIFAGADDAVGRRLDEGEVWKMAASLLAEWTGAEAALVRVWPLAVTLDGPAPERVVRRWLDTDERVVYARVRGSRLKEILRASREQDARLARGLPVGPVSRFTAGGVDGDRIHGAPIEDQANYRIATTRVLADALELTDREPVPEPAPLLEEVVVAAMRARRGAPSQEYRAWAQGKPVAKTTLWKVNFRDVGLNVQNTKVVRDDAFNVVPNARVQGFDELLVGGVFKADADYLNAPFKWSNTLEMEYARSRLRPRNAPPVTNTAANRIQFLTTGTRRVGAVRNKWLGSSWGPSLGIQYEGQFEAAPGLRRRNIYSAFPGVQFYEGTFIRSMDFSANIRRDLSRDPPNTQYGLHTRWVASHAFSRSPATFSGELFANYFFLTRRDRPQDLRLEAGLSMRLRFPIRRHLSVAPFIDLYAFGLKTRPLYGYSAMTGVSIGFARLWKPQYERF